MSLFNDYKGSGVYAFIERVAKACSNFVKDIIDRLRGNK